MNNVTVDVQNFGVEGQTTRLIAISSFGFSGGLGTVIHLLLICFQLRGFRKRKAYEYILFAMILVDFLSCIFRCCLYTYVIAQHDDHFCKYCGLINMILIISATMLLTVNMLHRYLSLYHPAVEKKISTNRGVILCVTLPIFGNVACYSPLLLFDAFGWDALGTCSMKVFSTPNNKWNILSGLEIIFCNIINVVLGLLVIYKIRAHGSKVQKIFKSQVIKESKQIVKLLIILTAGPMITNGLGFTMRLLPPQTVASQWLSRTSLVISPLFVAMMPVIMIIVIKHYRKDFIRFLKFIKLARSNQST